MFRLFPKKLFIKTSSKLIKRNPDLEPQLRKVLISLKKDPFTPSLKTHKLKGDMEGLYACSLTHELRIIFELSSNIIRLLDIGSHDEVY